MFSLEQAVEPGEGDWGVDVHNSNNNNTVHNSNKNNNVNITNKNNNVNITTKNNVNTLNNNNRDATKRGRHTIGDERDDGHIATVEGFIGRRFMKILLDSGADQNFISRKTVESDRLNIAKAATSLEILGAGGAKLHSHSVAEIVVTIGQAQGQLTFRVVEDEFAELPFVILGASTLHEMEARFHRDSQGRALLTIAGQECYFDEYRRVFRPRVLDLETLEPPIDEESPLELEVNFEEMSRAHVWGSRMVAAAKVPLLARSGTVFATMQKEATLDDVPANISDVGQPDPDVLRSLNPEQLARLNRIQRDLVDLSMLKLEDAKAPAEFSMGEQYLTLKTDDPRFPDSLVEPQRLHGKVNTEVLDQYIKEGLRNGNIEIADPQVLNEQDVRCTTNHCFPVSGRGAMAKVRASIVATLLNVWTVAVGIFRLIINQVKQRVDPVQCKFMSVIDIRWAFNLIEIEESMRPRTTFYGADGRLYWYKRMPFGLKNAPACWQAFVSSILAGIACLIVFVDDLFMYSRSIDAHLDLLERIVAVFKKYRIPVRWQKLQLFRLSVNFLGAIWSSGGKIEPNVASLETVAKFPVPRDKKQLKSFVGVCRWLAQYVPELEKYLGVLNPLMKKTAMFAWTDAHQSAFEGAKEAIRNRLRINLPNYADDAELFKVVTDASDWGFGAILLQGSCLLGCHSHAWNEKEIKWGTITQEAYGVYATLNHWRDMLYGIHFDLETDHRPLVNIMEGLAEGKGSKMVHRWFTFLLQFDMKIRHIAGEDNVMADYLSRMSTGSEDQIRAFLRVKAPEITINDLEDGDADDVEGGRLYSMLSTHSDCPYCNRVRDESKPRESRIMFMKISEAQPTDAGYLALVDLARRFGQPGAPDPLQWSLEHPLFKYRQSISNNARKFYVDRERLWYQEDGDEDSFAEPCLVVPESQQRYLFQELHSSTLAGHGGQAATKARFARYYWPGKAEMLEEWIKHCDRCQRAKVAPPANVRRRPLQPSGVWERVHVDLIDMSKSPSASGHMYIMIVRDSFSRFMYARALYDKTAKRVASKLWKLFAETGQPLTVFVDDGSEFVNELNLEFAKQAGVLVTGSVTLMKSSNGTVERANRIAHQYLRLVNAGKHWNRYLSFMCHANNSSVCTATGVAPCVLFFGRQFVFNHEFQALRHEVANLQADEWEPLANPNKRDSFDMEKFAEFLDDWNDVRESATQRDVHQKQLEKRRFERKRRADRVPVVSKGMRVLLEANPDASGHKGRDLYLGPEEGYEVLRADPDGLNVTILDGDVERTVHANRLRVYRPGNNEPALDPEPTRSATIRSDEAASVQPNLVANNSLDNAITAVDAVRSAAEELHLDDDVALPVQKPGEEEEIGYDFMDREVDEPLPADVYVVQRILAARGHVGRDRMYRIEWEGYGPSERSDVAESHMAPNQLLTDAELLIPHNLRKDCWYYQGDALVDADEIAMIRCVGHKRTGRSKRGQSSRRNCVVTVVLNNSYPNGMETKVSIAAFDDNVVSRPTIFENEDVMEQFRSARDAWKSSRVEQDDD